MIIKSIELKNFRNYEHLELDFDSATNILYGDNAQGKTTVLESAYVCATTKSHKGSRDKDMIRFGEEEAHIRMTVCRRDQDYQINIHLKKNRSKGIAIGQMPIKKASELFGILNIVFFSPEDLNIIKNGPSVRRPFLDLELCQLNKLYVHALIQYNRVITQRNKLLKDLVFHPEYEETLDIWDEQMIQYGSQVIQFRQEFIEQLNNIILSIHKQLSGEEETLELFYEANTSIDQLKNSLAKSRESDLRQKTTGVGPHRDDISFMVNGIDIRKFGSQGQQRTAALSLKLAEIELVKHLVNDYPILLLDDVLSELDGNRQKHLLSGINHIQTMITCTGLEDFLNHRFPINKVYRVVKGTVISDDS